MEKEDDEDLQDVILEETMRGRRRIDLQARRERAKLNRAYRKLLDIGSEDEFLMAIRALGLRDGSPRFLSAVQAWRENRRR